MKYPYGSYLFRIRNGFASGTFEKEYDLSAFFSEEIWASMNDNDKEDWLKKIGYELALEEIHIECLPVKNTSSPNK